MISGWWRRRRRAKLLAQPFPPAWPTHLEQLSFYGQAPEADRKRLRELVRVFIDEVYWEGCGGLELTDAMRVLVAAQACRMILRLSQDDYRKVKTILVYPSAFRVPVREGDVADEPGVHVEPDYNAGEAWVGGPVILAWDDTRRGFLDPRDGKNLVYHEFAHKLDMLDGYADGSPPALGASLQRLWTRVLGQEYAAHFEAVQAGKRTFLDPYGATDPAEFFAVASETFFERPHRLRRLHGELYGFLVQVYRQDPAETGPAAGHAGRGSRD